MYKQLFVLAAGMVIAAQASAAGNLIENGNFEAGNSGFTSSYGLVTSQGPFALWGEGTYAVGQNSDQYHMLWADVSNHTVGGSQYMIVNGAPDVNATVWQSNALALLAGSYTFSAYVTDICCNASFYGSNALPVLSFSANAVSHVPMTFGLGTQTVAVDAPGTWYQLSATFTIDADTSGYVSLTNAEGAYSGNDFGLDDISLTRAHNQNIGVAPVPEPASWTMMVGGFGLVGGTLRRRQRSALRFA